MKLLRIVLALFLGVGLAIAQGSSYVSPYGMYGGAGTVAQLPTQGITTGQIAYTSDQGIVQWSGSAWVAYSSGSGTVNTGTTGQLAYYASTGTSASYDGAIYTLAAADGLPVIDLVQRWVSYAAISPVIPYGDAGLAGQLHPSQVGYYDIAKAVHLIFPP